MTVTQHIMHTNFALAVLITSETTAHATETKELESFVKQIKANLVFVEGGEFLMGDFGMEHAPERLPYDREKHSKPLTK